MIYQYLISVLYFHLWNERLVYKKSFKFAIIYADYQSNIKQMRSFIYRFIGIRTFDIDTTLLETYDSQKGEGFVTSKFGSA